MFFICWLPFLGLCPSLLGTSIYPLRSIQSSKHGKYGSLGQDKRVGGQYIWLCGSVWKWGCPPTKMVWLFRMRQNDDETYLFGGYPGIPYPIGIYIYIYKYWLVVWNMAFVFPNSWEESFQLTNSYFFRGVGQPPISIINKQGKNQSIVPVYSDILGYYGIIIGYHDLGLYI